MNLGQQEQPSSRSFTSTDKSSYQFASILKEAIRSPILKQLADLNLDPKERFA